MSLEAIILAGGFGTRLKSVVSDVPKSMALVNGRPFLEYLLDHLLEYQINKVVLAVGYKREVIINHFGESYRGIDIDYSVEEEPLGTGGGIRLAFWKISGPRALVLNGDTMFRVDYHQLIDYHLKKKAQATIALWKTKNTGRYGLVTTNRAGRITGFLEKDPDSPPGTINGGVYVLEQNFLMQPDFRGRFSIERDCFQKMCDELRLFGFKSEAYFHDIGIPEDYAKAQHDFKAFEG